MNKLFPSEDERDLFEYEEERRLLNTENELLNTIKVPQNLAQLTKRLPKSNYNKLQSQSSSLKKREMQTSLPQTSVSSTSAIYPVTNAQGVIKNRIGSGQIEQQRANKYK
jgi:hypothetical protein